MTLLCAVIGSGAATALVTGLLNRQAARRRLSSGESQGMRWLLQNRLEHLALEYLSRGDVSYEALRNWNRGHYIYHDLLGGNGDLNNLKSALQELYQQSSRKDADEARPG